VAPEGVQAKAARVAEVAEYSTEIATDERLGERERRVWAAHCILFADNADHCASVARLAAIVYDVERPEEKHIRAVQRANERLIECGYLERTIRGSEAHRETNYWRPRHRVTRTDIPLQDAKNAASDTLRSRVTESLDKPDLADERGGRPQAPATLDEWEWQADAHGADELNGLEMFSESENIWSAASDNLSQPADRLELVAAPGGASYDPNNDWTVDGKLDAESQAWAHFVRRARSTPTRPPTLAAMGIKSHRNTSFRALAERDPDLLAARLWRLKRRMGRKMSRAQHEQLAAIVVEMEFYLARAVGGHHEAPPTGRSGAVDLPAFLTGKLSPLLPAPRSQAPTALSPPLASITAAARAAQTEELADRGIRITYEQRSDPR
jgi:hypothetical protein